MSNTITECHCDALPIVHAWTGVCHVAERALYGGQTKAEFERDLDRAERDARGTVEGVR